MIYYQVIATDLETGREVAYALIPDDIGRALDYAASFNPETTTVKIAAV